MSLNSLQTCSNHVLSSQEASLVLQIECLSRPREQRERREEQQQYTAEVS
jgi:hypothetical protein